MSVAVDPLASLKSWPLTVTVAGQDYELRAVSAAQWLTILLEDPIDLSAILPGLLSEEAEEAVEDAMMAGRLTKREIEDICHEVIGLCAGRDWWWALNLIRSVASAWMLIYGRLMVSGVNLDRLPLGAALDAMYALCVERMDKEHHQQFDRDLERPPVNQEIDANDEEAQFLALMNSR